MIAKEQLKDVLLATTLFINNQHLDDYLELIYTNNITEPSKYYCEDHHAIPVAYYKKIYNCKSRAEALQYADADKNNFTSRLLYKDHCKAH